MTWLPFNPYFCVTWDQNFCVIKKINIKSSFLLFGSFFIHHFQSIIVSKYFFILEKDLKTYFSFRFRVEGLKGKSRLSLKSTVVEIYCRWNLLSLKSTVVKVYCRWNLLSLKSIVVKVDCRLSLLSLKSIVVKVDCR